MFIAKTHLGNFFIHDNKKVFIINGKSLFPTIEELIISYSSDNSIITSTRDLSGLNTNFCENLHEFHSKENLYDMLPEYFFMTRLEYFLKFAEKHELRFDNRPWDKNVGFCYGFNCDDCVLNSDDCYGTISYKEYEELKISNPEYFL